MKHRKNLFIGKSPFFLAVLGLYGTLQAQTFVVRTPTADEKPVNNQFYGRDDKDSCTVYYKGTLNTTPDSVYLKVYAGTPLYKRQAQKLSGGVYNFAPTLSPGLVEYKIEFGSKTGTTETILNTVNNVLCGDAYIVEGQSNAVGIYVDGGVTPAPLVSEWIRTFGNNGENSPGTGWANAVWNAGGGVAVIGYWPLELARKLVTTYSIPICILNGAVGGTRVDQHQRSTTNPTDINTIYGKLLTRAQQSKLTHNIRGLLWHQGESDNTLGLVPTYQSNFLKMAASWKSDYPNIRNYYLFQIMSTSCFIAGTTGADNSIREIQRTLPSRFTTFPRMSIMSTQGIKNGGGDCHFEASGYLDFMRLMSPLVERDNYAKVYATSITPPDIMSAYYTSAAKTAIALEFDQPVLWTSTLISQFYLDGIKDKVASGSVVGNVLTLTLKAASAATKIMYLDGGTWRQGNPVLYGANTIGALTFANVTIYPDKNSVPVGIQASQHLSQEARQVQIRNGLLLMNIGSLPGQSVDVQILNIKGQKAGPKSF